MTIIMNMCSYSVEENSNSEISNELEANFEAVNQAMMGIHQPRVYLNLRSRYIPISLATVDIEIFLRKMSTE